MKTFEQFLQPDDGHWKGPAVVLNLKERDGKILPFHPIYAVTTTNYEIGFPPLIQQIARNERTDLQKSFLKLASYFENEFTKTIELNRPSKRLVMDEDPYGEENWGDEETLISYLEDKGYDFRKKVWPDTTEITTFFRTKEQIDSFINYIKEFV